MKKIKIIVLEDEPESLVWLVNKLNQFSELEVKGSGASTHEGIELIRMHQPDAMFVDIELIGDGNVFDMINKLKELNIAIPITVITTAYPDYIFTAFNDHSQYIVQYLVKPFAFGWQEKIQKSIAAITKRLSMIDEEVIESKISTSDPKQTFLFLPINGSYVKVTIEEIIFLQAKDGDTFIYTDSKHYALPTTLTKCMEKIPNDLFKRISRQFAVSLNRIVKIKKAERKIIIMHGGKQIELEIGDSYYGELLNILPIVGS